MNGSFDLLIAKAGFRKRWIVTEKRRDRMAATTMTSNLIALWISNSSREWLPRALVPLAVFTAMWAFRRYVPARSPRRDEANFDDIEAAEFRKIQWIVGVAILVVMLTTGFFSYKLLVFVNRWIAGIDGPGEFVLYPQQAIWSFLPGSAGLCFSWEIVLWLWRRVGDGRRAGKYEAWSNAKSGMDGTKVLRWMGLLIAVPIGVLTLLALPMHCVVGSDAIRVRGYATLSETIYRYSGAVRLAVVDGYRDRDGNLNKKPGIILDFKDGRSWDSRDGTEILKQIDATLLQFIESKTALTPEHYSTAKDIPNVSESR